ncbi:MAG: hypothetical protein ACTSQK_08785 [Candidatus Heimdallarchaeota archaeon]
MRHTKGKKIGLMIFIITAFLAIPIATVYAQDAMKGDPVIECVASKLILPEKQEISTEETSFGTFILCLNVELKATKHYATDITATLRFKNRERLAAEETLTGEQNNPEIVQKQAHWDSLKRGTAEKTQQPFEITGFQHLPEEIEFELDVTYRNPNDEELYATTLSIIPGIPDTTIQIDSVTNPPDAYKGNTVPITIKVTNIGTEAAFGLFIGVTVRSIEAGARSLPYVNTLQPGGIELSSSYSFLDIFDYYVPQEQVTVTYHIPCTGYSNGAMNIGKWKIVEIEAYAYNAPSVVLYENNALIAHPNFQVNTKAKSAGQHAVFIYYLWNSGGAGDNWGGTNPKPWLVDGNGDGNRAAGLSRFAITDIIPVTFNMIFAYDNPTWDLPSSCDDAGEMFDHGDVYVGSQLHTVYPLGTWNERDDDLSRYNCGFDILIMAAGRNAGEASGLANSNRAFVAKAGPSTSTAFWERNIDGVIQHEVSHLFDCKDYPEHSATPCIMFYKWTFWPEDYLHEVSVWPFARQYPYWCSVCQAKFDANWNRFSVVSNN